MAASKGTLLYVDEMMKKNIKKGTQTKSLYWIDYTDRKRERMGKEEKGWDSIYLYLQEEVVVDNNTSLTHVVNDFERHFSMFFLY